MKARPILMSSPMVRVLLDGRKAQTRRVVKPSLGKQSEWATVGGLAQCPSNYLCEVDGRLGAQFQHPLAGTVQPYGQVAIDSPYGWFACPYGKPGDLLWVRETWAHYQTVNHIRRTDGRAFSEVSDGLAAYRADGHDTIDDLRDHIRLMSGCDLEAVEINGDRWRPSIHMPRWASRLTLELTEVRVERLQDISEADAIAEGIEPVFTGTGEQCGWLNYEHEGDGVGYYTNPVDSYASLWRHLNGPDAWNANPWVWVLSSHVHQKHVDALLAERGARG